MIRRVAHLVFCVVSSVFLIATAGFAGTIIHVPANQPTIQAGINAASNGDTVLVAPGTYYENINFNGKAITVASSGGAKVTIIDGSGVASVIVFDSNETSSSVLEGFTIQNGNAANSPLGVGGGIAVEAASPVIETNVIQNNIASTGGGGIGIESGSPIVRGNIIRNNSQALGLCCGFGGGGISLNFTNSAQIIGNVIQNNTWSSGGGISLYSAYAFIKNNLVVGNRSQSVGAGISMFNNVSQTVILQNVITGNSAPNDAGIYCSEAPAAIVSNTITDGPASTGTNSSIVVVDSLNPLGVIADNIIFASNVASHAFYCSFGGYILRTNFFNNNVFSTTGAAYGGDCKDQTRRNGNISADPKFVSTTDLRLNFSSPAIDAGSNSAPNLPTEDFAGNQRIINGNNLATAIVDMGAYEFVPVVLAPKSLSFGLHAVGSSTSKVVKLTNEQNKVLNISSYSVPAGYSVTGCGTSIAAFKSCTLTVTFHPLTSGTFKGVLSVKDDAGNSPQTVSLSGSAQ